MDEEPDFLGDDFDFNDVADTFAGHEMNWNAAKDKSNSTTKVCKFCNEDGFEWTQVQGKWKMRDCKTKELHNCFTGK